jgi:hypothetical protein
MKHLSSLKSTSSSTLLQRWYKYRRINWIDHLEYPEYVARENSNLLNV